MKLWPLFYTQQTRYAFATKNTNKELYVKLKQVADFQKALTLLVCSFMDIEKEMERERKYTWMICCCCCCCFELLNGKIAVAINRCVWIGSKFYQPNRRSTWMICGKPLSPLGVYASSIYFAIAIVSNTKLIYTRHHSSFCTWKTVLIEQKKATTMDWIYCNVTLNCINISCVHCLNAYLIIFRKFYIVNVVKTIFDHSMYFSMRSYQYQFQTYILLFTNWKMR